MARIDAIYLDTPFFGSRQMVRQLRREGYEVGRHRVRRLMRQMGLQAIYRAPRTHVRKAEVIQQTRDAALVIVNAEPLTNDLL